MKETGKQKIALKELDEFQGRRVTDILSYYMDKKTNEVLPTKKG